MNTLLMLALWAPTHAFAQSTQTPLLETLVRQANTHLVNTASAREKEAQKGKDFDPCTADILSLQETYDQWFTRHESQFAALRDSVQSEIKRANAKLKALQSFTIAMNAVEGQTTSSVDVSLPQLIAYFKNLNERLEGISADRRELLMKKQENPTLNPLKLAHSQVLEAMKLLTDRLNASLREQSSQYELGFNSTDRHFSLEYRVTLLVAGKRVSFDLSLLESGTLDFELSEQQLWNRLSRDPFQIDGQPVDGRARYRAFRDQYAEKNCVKEKRVVFPGTLLGLPYATLEDSLKGSVFASQFAWDAIAAPGGVIAQEVYLAADGTVYIICPDPKGLRTIYSKSFSSTEWKPVTQGAVQQLAIAPNGDLFAIGLNGNIYRKRAGESFWSYYAGRSNSLQLSLDNAGQVHHLVAGGHIGVAAPGSSSYQISSGAGVLGFSVVNGRYYTLLQSGEIYIGKFDGQWENPNLPQAPVKPIQLALSSEESIFILGEDGSLYAYADGFWTQVTPSASGKARIISISTNSLGQVVGIDVQGLVYTLKEKQK